MVNPIQTDAAAPLVRLVGADGLKAVPNMIQYPQIMSVPDTSLQNLQKAQNNTAQGYEIVADTYGKLANIRGQAVPRENFGTSIGRSLQQSSETLTQWVKVEAEKKRAETERAEKAAAEEKKLRQDSNYTDVNLFANETISKALEQARTDNPIQARSDLIRAVMESDIGEDDKRTLINRAFNDFNGLYKEWDDRKFKAAEKAQNAYASNVQAKVEFQSAFLLGELTKELITPERANEVLLQIDELYDNEVKNSGLDPIIAMETRTRILQAAQSKLLAGTTARAALDTKVQQYSTAQYQITKTLQEKYGGDASNPNFRHEAAIIATQNGLPSAYMPFNKDDQFKYRLDMDKQREALESLQRTNLIDSEKAKSYTQFQYGQRVLAGILDPSKAEKWDPEIDSVPVGLLKAWNKDKNRYYQLRQEIVGLNTRIAEAANPRQSGSTSQTTNTRSDGTVTTTTNESKSFTPANDAKVAALQTELTLRRQEMAKLEGAWAPFGLNNFDNPSVSMSEASGRNAGTGSFVSEWQKQNPNSGVGSSRGPYTAKTPTAGSLQVIGGIISPFSTNGGGRPELGRTYAGAHIGDNTTYNPHNRPSIDYVVDPNTPIYSVLPGTVVAVGKLGGYGMRVEVKHADGTRSLFGHLNSALVKVGDTVGPAQRIGLSGGVKGHPNAGTSTGSHLHFEVFDPTNTYSIDPIKFLKNVPQQIARAQKGYGLPPTQTTGRSTTTSLAVISMPDGSYLDPRTNVHHKPGGVKTNIKTGQKTYSIPTSTIQKYESINSRYGITPTHIKKFGYVPQREALPTELKVLAGTSEKLIGPAASAWNRMQSAAASAGVNLRPISAFRSVETQRLIVEDKVKRQGMSPEGVLSASAPAGYSEHHTGNALDIGTNVNGTDLNASFEQTKAFAWLKRNAAKYGFSMSYPGGTGQTQRESWHWQYVGGASRTGKKAAGGEPPISIVKPLSNGRVPIHRQAYPSRNNPNANYGYDRLAKDTELQKTIARVADNLGIPGQFLADIIDYENDTWSPSRYGGAGDHYVGLFQFGALAAKDLGTTREAIARMTPSQQVELAGRYIKLRPGKHDTIEQVYQKINNGNSIDKPYADGNNEFSYHVKRLGNRAGRRYQTSYDTGGPIHTSYRPGCSLCNSLASRESAIVPHRGA
jgi:LAS superfamily LD-carboxypeptidase LdcB/murein DD-endopeptidase MepM/ murein hydrolase activator NlpD